MDNTWLLVIYGIITAYFGIQTIQIVPTLLRLLAALWTGSVKWPGPRIHDPDPSASRVRERLGVGYQNLFPTFIRNASSVIAGFVYFISMFLSHTPLLTSYVYIKAKWWWELIWILIVFVGCRMAIKQALRNIAQVNALLFDVVSNVEPRAVDGQSAEAEYAIEHPLIGQKILGTDSMRALDLYYESVRCHQDGNEQRALILYQEAMDRDPSLHKHARESLTKMLQSCTPKDAGLIFYWLGVHSEYLTDLNQAGTWYEKAIDAFSRIGYHRRESRAHCNLGHVKMYLRDPSAVEEFEKACALNPRNGTAYINIGMIYYGICEPGDYRY